PRRGRSNGVSAAAAAGPRPTGAEAAFDRLFDRNRVLWNSLRPGGIFDLPLRVYPAGLRCALGLGRLDIPDPQHGRPFRGAPRGLNRRYSSARRRRQRIVPRALAVDRGREPGTVAGKNARRFIHWRIAVAVEPKQAAVGLYPL